VQELFHLHLKLIFFIEDVGFDEKYKRSIEYVNISTFSKINRIRIELDNDIRGLYGFLLDKSDL